MIVRDIMSTPVVTLDMDTPLEQVAQAMLDHRVGCVVVTDSNGKAAGIVTERHFIDPRNPFQAQGALVRKAHGKTLQPLPADARQIPAHKIMRNVQFGLSESDTVQRAAEVMMRHAVHHVVVLRDSKPVGVVSRHDLLRVLAAPEQPEASVQPSTSNNG